MKISNELAVNQKVAEQNVTPADSRELKCGEEDLKAWPNTWLMSETSILTKCNPTYAETN